ncbi:MAG: fibronectin type III domain-containing protein, partial [Nitrospiria bacterium]
MTYRPIITMIVLWCLAAGSPAQATTALVAWDPNLETDMAGYKVYYGSSGAYTQTIDVGTVTAQTISGLQEGLTYYFAVTAYDASGNESGYSQEMSKTIPDT